MCLIINPFKSPESDKHLFSPNSVNTQSREKVGRIDKIIPQGKCFDLLSNSLNLCTWKCTETSLKNLYVDIGAILRVNS